MCNPEWFNFIKGCTSEAVDRTDKSVAINNALDTVFHMMPDVQLYNLEYVETISTKTEKIAEKIYKYDFDHSGKTPLFKDAITAVEDVIAKTGMDNPVYDNIGWIKENIRKYDLSEKIENSLGKMQAFMKSAFTTLDDTFRISKGVKLENSPKMNLKNSIS